jgi:pimeloyl-ACP methyl ester carboxylesterase
MSRYQNQGIDFHFEIEGAGFPLLFFHGLGGDWTQCRTMLERVRGFEKMYLDFRGHGSTYPMGSADKMNFRQFAQDVAMLAQHLGYDRFIAGGISMGSAIAIRLALLFPHCIEALILVRPAWLNEPCPENLKELIRIGELLQKYDPAEGKRFFMEREEFAILRKTAPAVADSLVGQFDAPNAGENAIRLIKIPASIPFENDADLIQIQQETLILGTHQDPVHPLWMAEKLADRMPRAGLAVVSSKSEDVDRHFEEVRYHLHAFLNKYRDPSSGDHQNTKAHQT